MKTCLTCKVECIDLIQHCKTDWHTYNLRRKTVGLIAISENDFKAKQNELILKSVEEPAKEYYCCKKLFKSIQTYENHLKSKKHLEKSSLSDTETQVESQKRDDMIVDDVEGSDSDETEEGMIVEYVEGSDSDDETDQVLQPLTVSDCFFCKSSSKTLEGNLRHMHMKHNFTLPYPEFISDLEGLMEYLVCLVDEYNQCLQCNKQFDNRIGVSQHMQDANHKILYFDRESNGDDLSDFYSDLSKPPLNLGDLEDGLQVEAVLPSGKRIGNRKMKVYFDQNLNGLSNVNKLAITSGPDKARMSLIQSGQYGSLTVQQATAAAKTEKKYKTQEARYIQLRSSRFSNFQQHFRAQILM